MGECAISTADGRQYRHSREGGNPVPRQRTADQWPNCLAISNVGGGRAALQLAQYAYWIPAFAGMTLRTDIFVGHYALTHDYKASLKGQFRWISAVLLRNISY